MLKAAQMEIYDLHEVYIQVGRFMGLHSGKAKKSSDECIFWGVSKVTADLKKKKKILFS